MRCYAERGYATVEAYVVVFLRQCISVSEEDFVSIV